LSGPKYAIIARDLKEKINKGIYSPGELIPSENELAGLYKVSRMTVRRSLSLLNNEGYTYSVPGKGYYVCEPQQHKYELSYNEASMPGIVPEATKLLDVNIVNSTKQLRLELQIDNEIKLIRIKRLFCSAKNPVAYDIKYIPYKRGEPIIEKEIRFANFPELVAQRNSLFTVNKELRIYCEKAKPEILELLQLGKEMPVVVIKQKFFDSSNKPLGLGFTYINPLRFSIQAYSFK
jgi:GntR family transcriptional regulator